MKKRRRRGTWKIVLLLIVLALIGLMVIPSNDSAMYNEAQVIRGDISTTYSFAGSLTAPRSQTVAATANAKVKNVYVEANQQVSEGDKLIALSTGEVIRAEIDGEVVSLNAEKDDAVSMGDLLAVVMDLENMEAEIYIDEYDVGSVEVGREVSVTVNAIEETCAGVIKRFDKAASSMGTMAAYKAAVSMDVPDKALPGMQVEVKMLNQSAEDTLLLKVAALQFDEENQVYVLTKNEEGEYIPTYIETGINDGTTIQVLSGLEEGQTVYYSAGFDMMALMQAMRESR
ncbi:MAG: efflux RND transporter periplasmic adaptor subunit [Clostridia bacterium]|nr:efflux RND transporter periplasmic adaptor subunit [Clostridia bacterium]